MSNTTIHNAIPDNGDGKTCGNCGHWRDKAWTNKGWGICDNPKNETKISLRGMITTYMRDLPNPEKDQMIEEMVNQRISAVYSLKLWKDHKFIPERPKY